MPQTRDGRPADESGAHHILNDTADSTVPAELRRGSEARIAAEFEEFLRRREARRATRAQLDERRDYGLLARHAAKLGR